MKKAKRTPPLGSALYEKKENHHPIFPLQTIPPLSEAKLHVPYKHLKSQTPHTHFNREYLGKRKNRFRVFLG